MGIATFLKGITWTKVAGMAIEYGPEFYRKAKERFQAAAPPVASEETGLLERIARLEKLLLEQEEVIRAQTSKIELLEKQCQAQETQLLVLKITAGVLTLGVIVLLAVLFK